MTPAMTWNRLALAQDNPRLELQYARAQSTARVDSDAAPERRRVKA